MGVVGASSAVLSAEYHMDENWTSGLGGVVPDMMPPRLLAALRYTPLMQVWIQKRLKWPIAQIPAAKGSKFNGPHFWPGSGMFQVRIFSSK